MSDTTPKRCAIYTRKSSEEGLDQAFNSLDAQRQAGTDYIRSQKHEGWQIIDQPYDDGGYSGGTTQRPALKQLLDDISHGDIDVVVVYKVDRLSRSLHDFAQMMKLFDKQNVSFVYVTQQFNTTTSMGRLTLNMLLSFAQFEREVTSERIRDKLAATKKKGMWVGGQPPLGYRLEDSKLVIIPEEAELVRTIFWEYLKRPSLIELADKLNQQGFTTKRWVSSKGLEHGGKPLNPKYLYRTLTHPIYIGKITHKDKVWAGKHKPIIDKLHWDKVHGVIQTQYRQTRHRWVHPYLLKGKLRTHEDFAMSPSTVHRPAPAPGSSGGNIQHKRLVRYYVSQKAIKQGYKNCDIKTINASHLDELVCALVLDYLQRESFDTLRGREQDFQIRDHWLRTMINRVRLAPDQLTIELNADQIEACKQHDWPNTHTHTNASEKDNEEEHKATTTHTSLYQPEMQRRGKQITLTLAIHIKRLDGKRLLLSPDGQDLFLPSKPEPKDHIVTAIGHAYHWYQLLKRDNNLTIQALAKQRNTTASRIHKYLSLINLSPAILKRALTGHLPPRVTLTNLLQAAEQLDWQAQHIYLNLDGSSHPG
jgi:site-specific DNA recombinase